MLSVVILASMLGGIIAPGMPGQRGPRTATLAIVVSDTAGAPLGGVLVRVEGAASRSARTEGGRIVFEELPPGPYRLRFEREGFTTLERDLVARAGAPIDVKVTLTRAAPVEPPPAPEPPPPPAPAPAPDVAPVLIDMTARIEKEFIGRGAGKVSPLACATGGAASLIQVQLREPTAELVHPDADEFLYVVAGEGRARLAGRDEQLRAGVFLMVPRGVPHTLAATGRNPVVLISTRAGGACETPPSK